MSECIDLSGGEADEVELQTSMSVRFLAKRVSETLGLEEEPVRKRIRTYVPVDEEPNIPAPNSDPKPASAGVNSLLAQLHAERRARVAERQVDMSDDANAARANQGQASQPQPLWQPSSSNMGHTSVPASPSRAPGLSAPVPPSTHAASNPGLGVTSASYVNASFLSFNIG